MRRKKLITFFVLLSITLGLQLLPSINQLFFVIKQVMIFIFIMYLIIVTLRYVYSYIVNKYKEIIKNRRLIYLRSFTILLFTILLTSVSYMQIRYIQMFDTPPLENITYFDEFGNELYQSIYTSQIPEIELIEKTDQRFHIKFIETFDGYNTEATIDDPVIYKSVASYSVTDVIIEYDLNQNVISFEKTHTIVTDFRVYEVYAEDKVKQGVNSYVYNIDLYNIDESRYLRTEQYYASEKEITTYSYSENQVLRTVKSFYINEESNYDDLNQIEHYTFPNTDASNGLTSELNFDSYVFQTNQFIALETEGDRSYDSEGNEVIEFSDSNNSRQVLVKNIDRIVYQISPSEIYEYSRFKDTPLFFKSDSMVSYFDYDSFKTKYLKSRYRYSGFSNTFIISEYGMNHTYIIEENDYGYQLEYYGFEDRTIDFRSNSYTTDSLKYYELINHMASNIQDGIIYKTDPLLIFNPMFLYFLDNEGS